MSDKTQPCELSLEQQFSLRSFESQVARMSQAQAQEMLVKVYEQQMIREAMYQGMLRKNWNIGPTANI